MSTRSHLNLEDDESSLICSVETTLEAPSAVTGFADVDESPDPASLVAFLDARPTIEGEREIKDLVLSLLDIAPGASIIDVGCGTGDDVRELATLVGSTGKIVGVDRSAVMIAESRRRNANRELPVDFAEFDAQSLGFPEATFDAGRAERLLVYLTDPERAVAELVRVVKPGRPVVVSDVDIGTWFIDSPDRETTRVVFNSFSDRLGSGWIGRSLPRLLQQAGMHHVECFPRMIRWNLRFLHILLDGHLAAPEVACQFAPGALEDWWQGLAERERLGYFHTGCDVFTVVGRKG